MYIYISGLAKPETFFWGEGEGLEQGTRDISQQGIYIYNPQTLRICAWGRDHQFLLNLSISQLIARFFSRKKDRRGIAMGRSGANRANTRRESALLYRAATLALSLYLYD